ncbi:hypothetical protein [Actinacidiphila oryziradicis]|nr:hypothetical protein [Actinacidiphila oryziradicis]
MTTTDDLTFTGNASGVEKTPQKTWKLRRRGAAYEPSRSARMVGAATLDP